MQLASNFNSKIFNDSKMYAALFNSKSNFRVDSRTIQKGDIFVAFHGDCVDGHDFVEEAIARGADSFILADAKRFELMKKFGSKLMTKNLLFVANPITTLIELARDWRTKFSYPVVGITGSVGKTTTKEMVKNILSLTTDDYLVSLGNQNTLIGVAMNILKMRHCHKAAIFEVGIGKIGSMDEIVELLRPTLGGITKVGYGHMEGLGDLNMIVNQKRKLFSKFSAQDIGIINGDQDELSSVSYSHPVIRFGTKRTNQIQARRIKQKNNITIFGVVIYGDYYEAMIPGCCRGRVTTALVAISIGYLLKIPNETLIRGIGLDIKVPGRFEMIHHSSGSVLINDSYNSNPDSLKSSLLSFHEYETDKRKIAVIGDMLELGEATLFWHKHIGRFFSKLSGIQNIIFIGKYVEESQKFLPINVQSQLFSTIDEAYLSLKGMISNQNNVFLFKGSRSINISTLVEKLQNS